MPQKIYIGDQHESDTVASKLFEEHVNNKRKSILEDLSTRMIKKNKENNKATQSAEIKNLYDALWVWH